MYFTEKRPGLEITLITMHTRQGQYRNYSCESKDSHTHAHTRTPISTFHSLTHSGINCGRNH